MVPRGVRSERRGSAVAYEIEVKDLEDGYVASVRVTTTPSGMREAFDEILPEVDAEILNAGSRPAGPPFAIYHSYGDDAVDMEIGIPLEDPIPTAGRVIGRELKATLAAVAWHHGPYTGLGEAHRAVTAWLAEQGKRASGPPWEVYWTGPGDDPDSSKWKTEVGYPFED
jgi:effector-binding domain-containing protein